MSDKTEKQLHSEVLYRGRILTLYQDTVLCPNGHTSAREVVRHPGGVCVLPVDEEENVTLITQYRYPFGAELLEAPAGKLERGEEVLPAGVRELQEETGLIAGEMIPLGSCYPSVGYTDEVIHLYLARDLTPGETDPDEDEFIDCVTLPLREAVERVLDGSLRDAKTCLILLKAWHFLKN